MCKEEVHYSFPSAGLCPCRAARQAEPERTMLIIVIILVTGDTVRPWRAVSQGAVRKAICCERGVKQKGDVAVAVEPAV